GAFRQGEVPVDDLGVARRRVFHPRLGEVIEMLLDLEVRGRGCKVERGRGGDRAADVVWSDKDVVRVRPGRELLRLEQAAKVADIGLDDVGRLALEQLAELVAGVDPL